MRAASPRRAFRWSSPKAAASKRKCIAGFGTELPFRCSTERFLEVDDHARRLHGQGQGTRDMVRQLALGSSIEFRRGHRVHVGIEERERSRTSIHSRTTTRGETSVRGSTSSKTGESTKSSTSPGKTGETKSGTSGGGSVTGRGQGGEKSSTGGSSGGASGAQPGGQKQ